MIDLGNGGEIPIPPAGRGEENDPRAPRGGGMRTQVGGDAGLSLEERLLVAALVSAIVKELQAGQPPLRQPAA